MKRVLFLSVCASLIFSLHYKPCKAQQNNAPSSAIDSGAIYIDRFDNNASLLGGYWFSYTDASNKGASVIVPSDIKDAYVILPERNNEKGLKFSYTLKKGEFQWDPYVAVGVTFSPSQLKTPFSSIKGIAYDYKGSSHNLIYPITTITDYAHYKKIISASNEWKTIIIPFSELKQPNWGQQVPFEADKVENISWQIMGRDNQTGELQIDNVRLLTILPNKTSISSNSTIEPIQIKEKNIPSIVKVADWPGFKKAAYSLSFDDNLPSQLNHVIPLLDKYDLKGTFYVLTNSTIWQQFKAAQNKGHEIGSHSVTHTSLIDLEDGSIDAEGSLQYELASPVKSINAQLPTYKVISFAYPYGAHNPHVRQETQKIYSASRGVSQGFNAKHPSEWMNLKINAFDYLPNRTLAYDLRKIDSIETLISQNLIPKGGWGIYLAHDVLPFSEAIKAKNSWHPVSKESLDAFAKWLKEKQDKNDLWIETVANVTRYIRERDAVTITAKEDPAKIELHISDDLADDIFNYPLTLEVSLPASWKKAVLKHGNKNEGLEINNGKIIISAIPDTGITEILKTE